MIGILNRGYKKHSSELPMNLLKPKWGQCCTLRMFVCFHWRPIKVLYNRLTVAYSFSSLFFCGMKGKLRPHSGHGEEFYSFVSVRLTMSEHTWGLRLSGHAKHSLCFLVAREVSVDNQFLSPHRLCSVPRLAFGYSLALLSLCFLTFNIIGFYSVFILCCESVSKNRPSCSCGWRVVVV